MNTQATKDFFDSRTPEDPAYWSPCMMDVLDDHFDKCISVRGKQKLEELEKMELNEIWHDYLKCWIKGMSMLHVVSYDFNTGNGSPYQYGWYPHGYNKVYYKKLFEKFKDRLQPADEHETVEFGFSYVWITRDLGYGKTATRNIYLDVDYDIPKSHTKITCKCSAKSSGDAGFHEEWVDIAKEMKAVMDTLKSDPLLKTDLRPYDTYPDLTTIKDPKDRLGIIKEFSYDTVGRDGKKRFLAGFVAAYKEAAEFCSTLPKVTFSEDLRTCTYKGKEYTADDVAYVGAEDRAPNEIHYLDQAVEHVLIKKYSLLDIELESQSFTSTHECEHFLWWWCDQLKQPMTDDLVELMKKYKCKYGEYDFSSNDDDELEEFSDDIRGIDQ